MKNPDVNLEGLENAPQGGSNLQTLKPIGKPVEPKNPFPYNPEEGSHWWEQLPENFYRLREEFHLDYWDAMRVQLVATTDYFVRSLVSVGFSLASARKVLPLLQRDYRSLWDFYNQPLFRTDPNQFFQRAKTLPKIAYRRLRKNYGLPGAQVHGLSFKSPFQPVNPDTHNLWEATGQPDEAHGLLFTHGDDFTRPTIMCIHGISFDRLVLNRFYFDIKKLYREGFNVAIYTLPYHGKRKAQGALYSGDGFVNLDVALMNETVAHGVHDMRIFIDHLRERGARSIGLAGMSLGGYHTALMAGIEDNLKFAITLVPVTSFIDVGLEWEPMSTVVRMAMKMMGHTVNEAREAMAIHTPLTYKPRLPKENLFIIAGLADRMASPKQTRLLWEHWSRPDIHWFKGNHLVHWERGDYQKSMHDFFRRIGVWE